MAPAETGAAVPIARAAALVYVDRTGSPAVRSGAGETCMNLPIAAVTYERDTRVDLLLEQVARQLSADGVRVAGYVQRESGGDDGCCAEMELEDLATGERTRISQPLGAEARGCRLDPQAMAALCGRFIEYSLAGAELVVLNRFGKGEAEGQGFRRIIEEAVAGGVPVLTAVHPTYAADFDAFGGGAAAQLPRDREAVLAWCRAALAGGR